MADTRILRDREKALENQFFARENEKLRQQLRDKQEKKEHREELNLYIQGEGGEAEGLPGAEGVPVAAIEPEPDDAPAGGSTTDSEAKP